MEALDKMTFFERMVDSFIFRGRLDEAQKDADRVRSKFDQLSEEASTLNGNRVDRGLQDMVDSFKR